MSGTVYVVHCIDAEGPLYQPIEATFSMIKSIFDLDIEPTEVNLLKLQRQQINLNGKESAVANFLDPNKINTLGTWDKIEISLNKILSEDFRNILKDSKGNGWIYNWFCIDHVGFTGDNPRRRDAGYHNIFDYYVKKSLVQNKDLVQFHFHPNPFSGNYNDSATAYWGNGILNQILCRKIIDRMWFPSVFRPGFHTERPDSHWFLEQWIPFDYANQSMKRQDTEQPDLSDGRLGDWRKATKEWEIYHPSYENYQLKGNCKRWIARCLNMHARIREISIEDIEDAFIRADSEDTLLSFTDHDFKNMEFDINKVRNMIEKVSQKYTKINFEYVNAIEGMRKVLKLSPKSCNLQMKLSREGKMAFMTIKSNSSIFGSQPFLSIKTLEGNYYWDNFDFQDNYTWTYTFNANTFDICCLDKIGVAANSSSGVTDICIYDVKSNLYTNRILND